MFRDRIRDWPGTLQIITGGLLIALGSIVITGWHTGSTRLLQISPSFVAMQYNTAICFFLSGIALIHLGFGFKRVSMCSGIIVSAFAALTLSQYLFNVNFGIDQMFMKSYITVKLSHPGRMAPNTGLCFMLGGASLLLVSLKTDSKMRLMWAGGLGAVVIAFGVMAMIGYATGFKEIITWGRLTQMALHTSLGVTVFGFGIITSVVIESDAKRSGARPFLPLVVGVGFLVATVVIWQALVIQEQMQIEREVKLEASNVKGQIESRLQARIQALVRMAKRWERLGQPTKERWEVETSLYVKDYADYQAVEWADTTYHIRWIEPLAGNEAALNLDVSKNNDERKKTFDAAYQTREVKMSRIFELIQGGEGFLVVVPIFRDERFEGFILGVFQVKRFFDGVFAEDITDQYLIVVGEDDKEIYSQGALEEKEVNGTRQSVETNLYGVKWSIQALPTTQLLEKKKSILPKAALGLGLLLAGLLVLTIRLAGKARLQAKEVEEANRELRNEIAERRLVTTALMEKESQMRSIMESASDAIISADRRGNLITWNKGAETIFGYTEQEALGQSLTLLIPEKFKGLHSKGLERYLSTGETKVIGKTVELEGLRKDKSAFPLELSLGTWNIGDEVFFSGIARDITDRKRTEEELHRVSTLLQTVSETTTDSIYVKDRDGKMLFANPATLEVIGKSADEVMGKSDFDWHDDPQEAMTFRANDLRIMEGGKTETIEEISTGPEGVRTFLSTKSPMRDEYGAVVGIIGISRNITGRKWAEDALKESEMRLQSLFESAPDAILVINNEGRITRANAVTEKMFGYSRDELACKTIEMLIPEKLEGLHTTCCVKQQGSQSITQMGVGLEVYALRKDESAFPVNVTLNPLSQDQTGDVIAIARDITEHKKAQEKINQSLVEKESLLKEIHHRVKNNMQVISSLLSLQSGYVTDARALEVFEESKQRVQTMALIHEKLYQTQDLSKIDFAEYIRDLATSIFATYSVNTEAVTMNISADQAFLKIHSAIPCGLIINELVTNAIKYAFPNGKRGEVYINFHKEVDGKNVKYILTVGDNGVGLPADLDVKNADSLGLRLVNILTNQLEGALEICSKNGAKFKVSFQPTDKE